MKTKQIKEELEQKNDDEIAPIEPKTRARKKATDANEDDKNKPGHDEPRTSRDIKKNPPKSTKPISKRPLGIRKTLRNKKSVVVKDKIKNVIKQAVKRGRKPAPKVTEIENTDKGAIPLIPACEIKKEPIDDTISTSRSSSPKTAGRRQRLTSDMIMMKAVLGDSPNSLVLGPRTSPYSMRSERSNSPSLFEAKNLRSGKPRKVKNNLLNEVVMKEQKKRRRLLSDSKTVDSGESTEACKKLKRVRSCSREGSEISKCSDITESDISLSEPLNDSDSKEVNKKIEKPKTDVDLDVENNIQISSIEKVPSNVDSKLTENKQNSETSGILNEKNKRKLSLKRSTSLDSDNNNSNRLKLDSLNTSDIEEKLLLKTDNDILLEDRSSILTSMSKTFNSKEMSKNIRKARRGRKAATASRPTPTPAAKNGLSSTETVESPDEKPETLESLSKEIDELITNLDQNIDCDIETANNSNATENTADQMHTKSVSKFYGMSKPLGDNNSIIISETPAKEAPVTVENAPSKEDDTENIRLHYQESSTDKSTDNSRQEITYKCTTVASIDKLMDRLKEFEEFDKRRQRQESESKSSDSKQVMVTNDVVLIPKSGADIKPLKDIQSVRSPEKPIEKENVLSCFENNSAISILKRDQVRKSIDVELPNSVTLIKRNSVSARKESTSSNHSRESDAISIFEKSLGKDVTLTEIRKSVDKTALTTQNQVDLHPFATLHPNNPTQSIVGVVLDSSQISITPRVVNESKANCNDAQIKHKSIDALSRKSTESCVETEEKMATLERIKSPPPRVKSPVVCLTSLPTPVAVKSPECTQAIETEALAPPLDNLKTVDVDVDDNIPMTTEVSKVDSKELPHATNVVEEITPETETQKVEAENKKEDVQKIEVDTKELKGKSEDLQINKQDSVEDNNTADKTQPENDNKTEDVAKTIKSTKMNKSARNSIECQPGPSNVLHETPESQKRKESLLRTIGLLTHKAAKEVKIEKLKEKERIYGSSYNNVMNKAKAPASKSSSGDYTGTLKTVIKLNRGSEKKKYRSSLKMTFQKSKNRSGKPAPDVGEAADEDDAYYTIERREGSCGATSDGVARKSYSNRLNIHDTETAPEPAEPSKETINLVIPEKASSFSIHPGRLCMDQCFYCGGKFGLFDTPCHIAQMKSAERQRKVLNNEEKLTIDSCLCDACYRHVDRRANCPSYRKKPTVKQLTDVSQQPQTSPLDNSQAEKSISPSLDDDSEEEPSVITTAGGRPAICHTEGCPATATHSIRRKWVIKMRNSINKVLKLEGDYPGLHTIPLCGAHHRALAPLMSCALCRRRIAKHSNLHIIHHGYTDFNPLLREVGIPVEFTDRPVLCKACRCYCNLLQKPGLNDQHARFYRRKLLRIYNIDVPPDSDIEAEEQNIPDDGSNGSTKQKKKARTKSKQRKSSDPDKLGENEQERISESPPEKEKKDEANSNEAEKPTHHLEEDIESLISSNKILVPPSVKHITNETNPTSDGSENETMDIDTPIIPIDKQTELQYLLQKQNNPAQFLQKTNLQQKHRNLLKVQNLYGIQKPGLQYRIHDKNTKKLQKITQNLFQKEKIIRKENEIDIYDTEKSKDGICILKNITLNEECTIESIPNKKPADINTLKNKWQMSESFTQVKKNLSELSKKLNVEKEPKKSDTKYSNPVKRLETNPSISVRELFPGEEEMSLQCNIEFNNVKGVTPEGWEKCNTTIQYDQTTKKLFNELQRPYGNLSSFLRHLVLLEKYYRSGDLVLSHNASTHAANYSDSVQSRLRAYDNIINDAPRRSEPAISLIEFRKKPSTNGKSLLKSNQNDLDKDLKKSMPPPGILPKPKSIKSSEKVKSKTLPPELIAINTPNAQGRKAIQNVLHNIQQLVKGVSASDPIEVASAPLPVARIEPPKEKKETPKPEAVKKQKTTSKPWRPTLMPITPENLARIAREPTQIAVDGRSLPSLVQVMSSGKRYHITLQDYNKMCIMRREKLQQLQDGDAKKKPSNEPETVVTEVQTSTMLGNGGTVVQNISPNKETQEKPKEVNELQIGANAATILKNVGLKNITIAPITQKTATVTSQTLTSPIVTSPSLLVTSTPIKIPQLGSAVSITSETLISSNSIITSPGIVMPKIPKSLTVIPQTVVASIPQNVVVTSTNVTPSVASVHNMDGQRP